MTEVTWPTGFSNTATENREKGDRLQQFMAALKQATPKQATPKGADETQIAALPAVVGIPAGATLAVAMVGVGALGISWNSLSSDEKRIVRDTVTEVLSDMMRRGILGLRDLGETIRNLSQFPEAVGDAIRRAVMDALALNARVPKLEDVIEAAQSLPVVNECQVKGPEDLIGMCGQCTADAYGQLREMGIKRITQEPVANGAHYVLKIMTDQGNYILDCTLGQFGDAATNPLVQKHNLLKGGNVVLMKEELYMEMLKTLPGRFYL